MLTSPLIYIYIYITHANTSVCVKKYVSVSLLDMATLGTYNSHERIILMFSVRHIINIYKSLSSCSTFSKQVNVGAKKRKKKSCIYTGIFQAVPIQMHRIR